MSTTVLPAPRPHDDLIALDGRPREGQAREERTLALEEALRTAVDAEETCLRRQLAAVNVPVALSVARRYRDRGIELEDLEQVALLGLTKAATRFDALAGHAFLSFCVPTVRGEVLRWFRDHGWAVRPPRRIQELQHVLLDLRATMHAELGHVPTLAELAERSGAAPEDVSEALADRACFHAASLDRRVGDDGDGATVGELLRQDETSQGAAEARAVLAPVVRRLSERDRRILQMRFFEDLTQREIAEEIGVTQMQVSRLLDRIFRDVRASIGELDVVAEAV